MPAKRSRELRQPHREERRQPEESRFWSRPEALAAQSGARAGPARALSRQREPTPQLEPPASALSPQRALAVLAPQVSAEARRICFLEPRGAARLARVAQQALAGRPWAARSQEQPAWAQRELEMELESKLELRLDLGLELEFAPCSASPAQEKLACLGRLGEAQRPAASALRVRV